MSHTWKQRGLAMLLAAMTLSGSAMAVQEEMAKDSTVENHTSLTVKDDAKISTEDDAAIVVEDESAAAVVEKKKLNPALPAPAPTGNDIMDIIAVAKSQVGYQGEYDRSIYNKELGVPQGTWCSEFVSWCAMKAGVDETIIPYRNLRSSKGYVRYFSSIGRYYQVAEYAEGNVWGTYTDQRMTLEDIRPGDIIVMDSNDRMADGPDHTCLVQAVASDRIITVDGDYDYCVKNSAKNLAKVHGVCRPAYTGVFAEVPTVLNPRLEAPVFVRNKCGNGMYGVLLTWKRVRGATGYVIERRTTEGAWERIGILDEGKTPRFLDKVSRNGTVYQYRVRATRGGMVGSYSKTKTMIRMEYPEITRERSSKKGTAQITWRHTDNMDGVQISYALDTDDGKTPKMRTVSLRRKAVNKYTLKSLKSKRYYLISLRSYKTYQGKTYYSGWYSTYVRVK